MAIAALVLWMFTAGVGLYLLMATIAARRARTGVPAPAGAVAVSAASAATVPTPRTPGPPPGPGFTGTTAAPAGLPGPATEPPPIPRVRVKAGPGDHPLLEFTHPALAITGLGCWLAYVATRYPVFAWFSFAVLVVAVGAGLGWLTSSARSARRRHGEPGGPAVPAHLILLHGLAAGVTLVLAVLTVLSIGHV